MCTLDVDAICACKILQFLLESFNLQYSVAPVSSIESLLKSFEEYRSSIDLAITINFGNLINLIKLLKPSKRLKFYVIDSHRPINVYNFYKNEQIKLFINQHHLSTLNIPPRDKIFLRSEGDELELDLDEEEEREQALLTADVINLTTEQLEKRRKLRDWFVTKKNLLFDYEEFQYYSRSVSMIIYELAYHLSKSNNYLLWLGIIGLTYQLKSDKISEQFFEEEAEKVIRHIARNQVSSNHVRGNKWTITWQKELQMHLMRHWTVHDSLWHTPSSVCKFKLWNDKGQKDFYGFLAECGLPLTEVKQPYPAMTHDTRRELIDRIQVVCLGETQYKYNRQDLISRAFIMKCGIKINLSAIDVGLAARAALESFDPESSTTDKFVRAMRCLSFEDEIFSSLNSALEDAKIQMVSMFQQVKSLISEQRIEDQGSFYFIDLQEHGQVSKDFARGSSLVSFTKFLLCAHVSSMTTRLLRRASRQPMILSSPDYHEPEQVLIVGVQPEGQQSKRNFFPKAFEQAAAEIQCDLRFDLSETNLVRCNINSKRQLIDQMKIILS